MPISSPILSIIIPCYNSAYFISHTIEMLFKQGLEDCELILVDDGSDDNTLEILRYYENIYDVKVIHQENNGVSVARNVGLAHAQGRYIYFLDSDDTLSDKTLDFFRKTLKEHPSCNMFAFGYEIYEEGKIKKQQSCVSLDNCVWKGNLLMSLFLKKKFCIHICSSIYERSFLESEGLQFKPGIRIGEDMLFIHQVLSKEETRVFYSSRICFLYQMRTDSVMQAYRVFTEDNYIAMRVQRDFFENYCLTHAEMRPLVDFYFCYIYLKLLYYYLRSDVSNSCINTWFCEDRYLCKRHIPMISSRFYIPMFLSRFLPIGLLLKYVKNR